MITLIAAGLRIDNIVFHGDHLDIALVADHLRDLVNIRCKRTYDTDTRNIIDITDHIIDRGFIAVFL